MLDPAQKAPSFQSLQMLEEFVPVLSLDPKARLDLSRGKPPRVPFEEIKDLLLHRKSL